MTALLKWALDWRTWLAAAFAALCVMLVVAGGQRDAEAGRADAAAARGDRLQDALTASETGRIAALNDKASAETALTIYANASIAAWTAQAEASARMADQIAQLNSRVRAAQQEIARADGSLRLDDPLPDSVRDALACAGGDTAACAPAADPGRMSGGPADAARSPVATSRGADSA